MKTIVILISVDRTSNGRKIAERIENKQFNGYEAIKNEFTVEEKEAFELYELADFMYLCNDQMLNLENFWVSYIQVPKETKI